MCSPPISRLCALTQIADDFDTQFLPHEREVISCADAFISGRTSHRFARLTARRTINSSSVCTAMVANAGPVSCTTSFALCFPLNLVLVLILRLLPLDRVLVLVLVEFCASEYTEEPVLALVYAVVTDTADVEGADSEAQSRSAHQCIAAPHPVRNNIKSSKHNMLSSGVKSQLQLLHGLIHRSSNVSRRQHPETPGGGAACIAYALT